MKPVTVITGAIAIIVGSVLLTGNGQADNNPHETQVEQTINRDSDQTRHREHSKFMNAGSAPGSF
jgi:hypothetical protein